MQTNHPMAVLASVLLLGVVFADMANGNALELRLRSRDPLSGNVKVKPTQIETNRLAVVVVDIWNWQGQLLWHGRRFPHWRRSRR